MSCLTFSSTSKTSSKSTTVVWSNIIKGPYTIIVTCLSDDIENRLKNKGLETKVSPASVSTEQEWCRVEAGYRHKVHDSHY